MGSGPSGLIEHGRTDLQGREAVWSGRTGDIGRGLAE